MGILRVGDLGLPTEAETLHGNTVRRIDMSTDDEGAVTGYLPATPPWASYPPDPVLTFEDDGDRPKLVMTVRGDPGDENVVYTFESIEVAATPTP